MPSHASPFAPGVISTSSDGIALHHTQFTVFRRHVFGRFGSSLTCLYTALDTRSSIVRNMSARAKLSSRTRSSTRHLRSLPVISNSMMRESLTCKWRAVAPVPILCLLPSRGRRARSSVEEICALVNAFFLIDGINDRAEHRQVIAFWPGRRTRGARHGLCCWNEYEKDSKPRTRGYILSSPGKQNGNPG